MRIGFDIDGVLFDWHRKVFDFRSAFGLEWEDYNTFMLKYFQTLPREKIEEVLESPWMIRGLDYNDPYTSGVLDDLHMQGHEIYLITSRDEKCRNYTEEWMIESNIYGCVKELIFAGSLHKSEIANSLKLQVFLDDRDTTFQEMDKNFEGTIYLRTQPHNAHINTWKRINKLYDYVDIIEKLDVYLRLQRLLFGDKV